MTLKENPYITRDDSWTDVDEPFQLSGPKPLGRPSLSIRIHGGWLRSIRHHGCDGLQSGTIDNHLSLLHALRAWDVVAFARRGEQMHAIAEGPASDGLREQFASLADQWKRETRTLSSMDARLMHRAYQRIIGLGASVVPLIIEDIEAGGRHWSWALMALTGEDVAQGADTPTAAAEAWVSWYRSKQNVSPR